MLFVMLTTVLVPTLSLISSVRITVSIETKADHRRFTAARTYLDHTYVDQLALNSQPTMSVFGLTHQQAEC